MMRRLISIPAPAWWIPVSLVALCTVAGCAVFERRGVEGERVLVHVVEEGDTLEGLADEYYGSPRRAGEIRRFNRIRRGDSLEAGTTLRIAMRARDMEALGNRRRARVPYNEGLALVERGAFLDASAKFRDAVTLDPRFAQARFNLGATYQKIGAYEKALEQHLEAAKLRPDDADYRCAVGVDYFHAERFDDAVREFRRAVRLDPFHLKARYSLAAALERAGRRSAAKKEWRRYLELDDSSEWADRARSKLEKLGSR